MEYYILDYIIGVSTCFIRKGGLKTDFQDEKRAENFAPSYSIEKGFYNPYFEPRYIREKHLIKKTANSIGLTVLLYVLFSSFLSDIVYKAAEIILPSLAFSGKLYVSEVSIEVINAIVYLFSLLVPLFIHIAIVGIPVEKALPFSSLKSDMAKGGVFIGLAMITVATYSTGWFYNVLRTFGIEATQPELYSPETPAGRIAYFISVVILPAFVEEMLLRGAVMQSLRPFGDTFALILSSVLFGMLHMNFVQMPYAFIMALCIGYFVMRSGSLWVGVIIHLINNGTATLLEFYTEDIGLAPSSAIDMVFDIIFIIMGFIALLVLVKNHKDLFRLDGYRGALSVSERVKCFSVSPVFVVAAVVMLIKSLKYLSFI